VALPCEAAPWIDYFKLKPDPAAPFRSYRAGEIALVVTGIGASACATAIGYIAGCAAPPRTCVWLNAGIAGHPVRPRGTLMRVDKCISSREGVVFYPSLPIRDTIPSSTCIAVDMVETEYRDDALYDMESAAFFSSACRFSFIDLVHAVKIVSDSPAQPTGDLDRQLITDLVAACVPTIVSELAEPLLNNARELSEESKQVDVGGFLRNWHFSVSNESLLRATVSDWVAVHDGALPDPGMFSACRNAREVVEQMRRILDSHPPRWVNGK
jgi:hypothetical protein